MSEKKKEKEEKKGNQLTVRHKTSPSYRTFTADGAHGSLTPDGKLAIDFYVMKASSPDLEIYDVDEKGNTVGDPKYQGFQGVTKEAQFGLVMTLNRVKELKDWLEKKLKEAEKATKK